MRWIVSIQLFLVGVLIGNSLITHNSFALLVSMMLMTLLILGGEDEG